MSNWERIKREGGRGGGGGFEDEEGGGGQGEREEGQRIFGMNARLTIGGGGSATGPSPKAKGRTHVCARVLVFCVLGTSSWSPKSPGKRLSIAPIKFPTAKDKGWPCSSFCCYVRAREEVTCRWHALREIRRSKKAATNDSQHRRDRACVRVFYHVLRAKVLLVHW
jgi:hypothetical protein